MMLFLLACAHQHPERRVLRVDQADEQYREAARQSHCFAPCKVEILKEAYERAGDPEMRAEILARLVEIRADEAKALGESEEAAVWRRSAARTGALLLREYPETEPAARYQEWVAEGLAPGPEP